MDDDNRQTVHNIKNLASSKDNLEAKINMVIYIYLNSVTYHLFKPVMDTLIKIWKPQHLYVTWKVIQALTKE